MGSPFTVRKHAARGKFVCHSYVFEGASAVNWDEWCAHVKERGLSELVEAIKVQDGVNFAVLEVKVFPRG